jgi:hypothetical protein
MGSFQSDRFRDAVVEALGRAIPDAVWEDCDDRVWRAQFASAKKGERDAAVRDTFRCVRDQITKALAIAAELNEEQSTPARDGANRRQDVLAPTQEQLEPFSVTLSAYEQNRAWAFALEVASLADSFYGDRIRRFREEELSGQLVSADDVEAFDRSPETHPLAPELSRLAEAIAGALSVWSTNDAAYYVLTDQPPPIPPVRGHFELKRPERRTQRGLNVMEIEPWVSEQTVARLYREVRNRVLPRHVARPRGMAVWRFVESLHTKPRPTLREAWRELAIAMDRPAETIAFRQVWRQWLAAHPELASMKISDACRRWNTDNPDGTYRYSGKFKQALVSGIEHGGTIKWPGYQTLPTSLEPGGAENN